MSASTGRKVIVLGVAVAVAACGVVATSAIAQSSEHPEAYNSLAVFGAPQTTKDVLPASIDLGQLGDGEIEPSSVRFLGDDRVASYWVGVDNSGEVCLLVKLTKEENSASACRPADVFLTRGLSLAVYGPGNAPVHTEAYLLPDEVSVMSLPVSLNRVTGNLLTGDTRSAESNVSLKTSGSPTDKGFGMRLFGYVELPPVKVGNDAEK